MHPVFLRSRELIAIDGLHKSNTGLHEIFGWLQDLDLDHALGIFNLCWGDDALFDALPDRYKTFVITPGTEYVDWAWIEKLCDLYPDRRVILISPYDQSHILRPNFSRCVFDVWPDILHSFIKTVPQPTVDLMRRPKKISALCNRISQFKAYICAYLHETWPAHDYVLSWRRSLGKEEDLFLLNATGNARVDQVIRYLQDHLWDLTIDPTGSLGDQWWSLLAYDWCAYQDCVINCSNESINHSFQFEQGREKIMPGPYLTEKTYKVLMSGTALFAVGQYDTYHHLEQQGFRFDYPWSMDYDTTPRDIDRMTMMLCSLDQIQSTKTEYLAEHTLASRQHNRDWIFSGQWKDQAEIRNRRQIMQFADSL